MSRAKVLGALPAKHPYIYNCVDDKGRSFAIPATTFDEFQIGKWYYVADIDNDYNPNNQRLIFDGLVDNQQGNLDIPPKNEWNTPEDLLTVPEHIEGSKDGMKYVIMKGFIFDRLFKRCVPGFRIDTVIGRNANYLILSKYGWASTVCKPEHFQPGDSVVVMFWNQDWGRPHVVGWWQMPRMCVEECIPTKTTQLIPQWIRIDERQVNALPRWKVQTTRTKRLPENYTIQKGYPNYDSITIPYVDASGFDGTEDIASSVRLQIGSIIFYKITMSFKIEGTECADSPKVKRILQRGPIDFQRIDLSDAIIIWDRDASGGKEMPIEFEISTIIHLPAYQGLVIDPPQVETNWLSNVASVETFFYDFAKDGCGFGQPQDIPVDLPTSIAVHPEIPDRVKTYSLTAITDNSITIRIELENGSYSQFHIQFYKDNYSVQFYVFETLAESYEVASGASKWHPFIICIPYSYSVPYTRFRPTSQAVMYNTLFNYFAYDDVKTVTDAGERFTYYTTGLNQAVSNPTLTFEKKYTAEDLAALSAIGIITENLKEWKLTIDTTKIGEKQLATIATVKERLDAQ